LHVVGCRVGHFLFVPDLVRAPAVPLQRACPRLSAVAGLTGECSLPRSWNIRQTGLERPLMRFVSLQRFQVVPRCRGRPGLATIPLRRSTFVQHRRGSVSGRGFGPCGFSPRVNRARHAPQDPRFTPVRTDHSPRSLFTRGVPLPVHEPITTGPDLLRFRSGNAPGILEPFTVFPTHGSRRFQPQAFLPGEFFRRSSPLAVC